MDIEANLRTYLGARQPLTRYTSFDYCFNYFQEHRERDDLAALLRGDALQLSCLHLGFYLASWGMFRGSAEVLQHSVRTFVPAIEVIANAPPEIWQADADTYGDGTCPVIFETAAMLRTALQPRSAQPWVRRPLTDEQRRHLVRTKCSCWAPL